MINKIGNWVFGSFFRTIGRLLVFVLLGVIIAHLVDFGSLIDNFRITDLFLERVNAEEVGIYDIGYDETYYKDEAKTNAYTTNGIYQYETLQTQTSLNQSYHETWFYLNNNFNLAPYKGGYITIPFEMNLPIVGSTLTSTINGQDYCDRWTWGAIDSYNQVTRWDCARVDQTDSSSISDREYIMPRYSVDANIVYNNGYVDICSYSQDTRQLVCPITKWVDSNWNIKIIRVNTKVFYSSSQSYNYYIYLHKKINAYSSAFNQVIEAQNQNTNAINNQTQQQQQQHNEIMDDNTTQAEDEASDFLGNFTVEDTGGLNAIITAPLSTIQSLLNNTCTKLTLPLPFVDKNIELPCLYPIYNEYFGAFFTIYQTIILGIISYRCIKSLFFDVKGFTNPEDDRIEVMDL